MAKIGVITTSFNDEKYIKNCLDHLLSQTFPDLEIICVDDASSDKTPEIIKTYAEKDPRIKPLLLEKNSGLSAARNTGLDAAASPYVMFCDGDDYYEPTMCEKMYAAIDGENVHFAVCEIGVIYEAHQEMKYSDDCYYHLKYSGRQLADESILYNIDASADNKIFRRDLIEKHHLRFPVGLKYEDTFFTAAYMFASTSVFFVNEPLYRYFRREGSIMSQTWSKETENDFSIDHIRIFVELHDLLAREKLFITDDNYDFFWRFYCDYISSAHKWCKSEAMRKIIRKEVASFIFAHEDEINAHVTPSTKNLLSHFNSPSFYSTPYKISRTLKDTLLKIRIKLFHKFGKISTSQTWAITKLKSLEVDTNYLRAKVNLLRKS